MENRDTYLCVSSSCSVGALGIELANRLLTFLNTLFDECKTERASVGQGLQSAAEATRFLQIHGDYTPQERVAFVARNTSINDLLFALLRYSFKNVCDTKGRSLFSYAHCMLFVRRHCPADRHAARLERRTQPCRCVRQTQTAPTLTTHVTRTTSAAPTNRAVMVCWHLPVFTVEVSS